MLSYALAFLLPLSAYQAPVEPPRVGDIRHTVERVERVYTPNSIGSCNGTRFELAGTTEQLDAAGHWTPFAPTGDVKLHVHRFRDVRPSATTTPGFYETMYCHLSFDAPGRWRASGVGGTPKLATEPGAKATFWATVVTPQGADAAPVLLQLPIEFPGPPISTPVQRAMMVQTGLWHAEEYDPIAVIRAVNALWAVGRDATLSELRHFASEAPVGRTQRCDTTRIDTADSQIVYFLVRLLFEPDPTRVPDAEFEKRVTMFRGYPRCIGGSVIWPAAPEAYPDARYPLVVVDDIPFLVPDFIGGRSGSDQCPVEHIEWAERFGRFRERPLQPGGDLIGAAQRAAASYAPSPLREPTSIRVWEASQIDAQLANALETALGRTRERFNERGGYRSLDSAARAELEAAWRAQSFRWNAEQQRYEPVAR